jgi:hypothetical protein
LSGRGKHDADLRGPKANYTKSILRLHGHIKASKSLRKTIIASDGFYLSFREYLTALR